MDNALWQWAAWALLVTSILLSWCLHKTMEKLDRMAHRLDACAADRDEWRAMYLMIRNRRRGVG